MRQIVLDHGLPAQQLRGAASVPGSEPSRTLRADLVSFVAVLKRQFWTMAVCVAGSLGLAGAYLILTPPKYSGTATVLTETSRSPARVASPDQQGMVDSAVVQSQIAMLNSEGLAREVIAKLKLQSDPEFAAPGLVSRLMSQLGISGPADGSGVADDVADTVLSRFMRALTVTRVEQSYVVEVAFTSRDPDKAAKIANAVAETYLDDQLGARMSSAQHADQWMTHWVEVARAESDTAAKAVENFRQAEAGGLAARDAAAMSKLDVLQKAAESKRRAYQAVSTRAERLLQFVENQSVPYTQARIVSEARASTKASSPKIALTVLLACFCGGILGVAVANLREAFDKKIRVPTQLGVAAQASRVVSVPWPRRSRPARGTDRRALDRLRNESNSAIWRLRTAVEQFAHDTGAQVLAIVSPHEEDGRSVIAAALADVMTQSGDRVLLVETDWSSGPRNGASTTKDQGAKKAGAQSVAVAGRNYDMITVRPARNGAARPAQMRQFETDLKLVVDQYKYVFIECPAILEHPEISASFGAADACIMVAHVASSSFTDIEEAREIMPFDRDQVIAVAVVARSG